MRLVKAELAILSLLALSLFLAPCSGVKVSGAIFEDDVLPGQETGHEIVVSLEKDAFPLNINAEVYGYSMNENGSNIQIGPKEDTGPYSAREYLTVTPNEFEIQPGESKKFLVVADIPADAGSGGRYALVILKTLNPVEGNKNVRILTAIQVPVLLRISGSEIVKSGVISDLKASKSGDDAMVNLRFENTGNYHFKPMVNLALRTQEGETVGSTSQQSGSALLPDGKWFFSVPIDNESELTPGTYTIEASVTDERGTILDQDEVIFEF